MRGSEERSLRKSLDTFTVLGPWMVRAEAAHRPIKKIHPDCRARRKAIATAFAKTWPSSFVALLGLRRRDYPFPSLV